MTAMRIYGLIWLLVVGMSGVLYSMGFINAMTLPIFAFVFSTLAAGGFLALLPAWLNEHYAPKTYPANERFKARPVRFRGTYTLAGRRRRSVAKRPIKEELSWI